MLRLRHNYNCKLKQYMLNDLAFWTQFKQKLLNIKLRNLIWWGLIWMSDTWSKQHLTEETLDWWYLILLFSACVCVCVCVCMHACVRVCVHACVHICVSVCHVFLPRQSKLPADKSRFNRHFDWISLDKVSSDQALSDEMSCFLKR